MASTDEIIDTLDALATHCRPPVMSTDAKAMWLRDWCGDLQSFPIESIRGAAGVWRQSGQTKFPTPGQFLPLVRAADRAPAPVTRPEPWGPITDEAYQALSLTDKIWTHQKLAHEANMKAAQLWRALPETRAGNPPSWVKFETTEPSDWKAWRQREANHLAEAKRLLVGLKQSKERGAA